MECFTPGQGRFPAIAKGVKGGSGRRGGTLLQPFMPLLIRWSGRGEVKTLGHFETVAPVMLLGRELYCGFYLNELLMRLLQRNDPHEQLFGIYAETLQQLARREPLEPLLRRFEVRLLEQLGYGLVLDRDVENESPIEPEGRYHYQVERGPLPARPGDSWVIRGSTLLGLNADRTLEHSELREALKLTRYVLRYYLGDRPLRSRELFRMGKSR